ncbi:MAG: phosphate transport system permease protein [Verrucomicrobiota bacterium]|nr:phosphate transport system permease protein [Verrucomicrobiota bacterium]
MSQITGMPVPTAQPPSVRPPTREALLSKRRGWFFGLTGEQAAKLLFQGNATISIIVLALITFTIFSDAVGFIPQNRENLEVYRRAGLELVDLLRGQVQDHSALARYLSAARQAEFARLTAQSHTPADANARLEAYDAFADRHANLIGDHETVLGEMTDLVSSLKERHAVAADLRAARQNLIDGMRTSPPERAAALKAEADAMVIETIDFANEIQPLLDMRPALGEANARLAKALKELNAAIPAVDDPALRRKLVRFQELNTRYVGEIAETERRMMTWDQAKPIGIFESLSAFAFGRKWVTASFWQDWYGIIPLFAGSLLIAALALVIAIPLGVAAAIYVNQVATPVEQKFIKPTIEFIAAIPSVVLGFFGIAVLGETLRRVSQTPWLDWVPGFPMLERLNSTTAACLLALMAVPTIFSLAEDAINNVPRSFKEASLALGATRLQTIIRITIPAALSGIMAAILLGFGRVIGETMVVLLCAGNRIEIPDFSAGLGAVFQPVHTMTGIIAQEMGEVVRHSIHYRALFMVGVVLFLISLLINWLAQKIVRRYRISIG